MFSLVPQSHHGRSRGYGKSKENDDIQHIIDLVAESEVDIGRAWMRFATRLKSKDVDAVLETAWERGDVEAMTRIPNDAFNEFTQVVPRIFARAGEQANKEFMEVFEVHIIRKVDVDPNIDISFNPGNAAAAAAMREAQLDMIQQILEEQRKHIRQVMEQALREGIGFDEASRRFKNSIGLTSYQSGIVDKFEQKLRTLDPRVMNSVLRDRRFDSTIQRAIERQKRLSDTQITRMVDRYRTRFIAMRAETIARTEGLRTVNAARHQAMGQLADKIGLEQNRIVRTWRSTEDLRTRYTHRQMNGQRRGAKEPFRSPRGPKLMYPGDRRAPPEESINCRCVVRITIKSPAGAAGTTGAAGQASAALPAPRVAPQAPPTINPYTTVADDIYRADPDYDFYIIDINKRYIKEEASRTKSTAEQIRNRLQKKTETYLKNAHIYVRIPDDPKILNSIIDSGRLRTQFETGTSRGALDHGYRANAEKSLFGVAKDAHPSARPIYGYATNDLDGLARAVQGYGYVALKLKPGKRMHTTVTGGDSLDRSYKPSPLNSPDYNSFDAETLDKAKSLQDAAHPFTEVQIGRGVSLADDVEEVIFYVYRGDVEMYRNYEIAIQRLDDMGVPTRIVEL